MDPGQAFILFNLAFWLGHYLGRNNSMSKPKIASSQKAPMESEFDCRALEDQQIIYDESEDRTRRSLGHTMQNVSDTKDEGTKFAAKFSDGRLVIEKEEVAPLRNAAGINRWRQGLGRVSG